MLPVCMPRKESGDGSGRCAGIRRKDGEYGRAVRSGCADPDGERQDRGG